MGPDPGPTVGARAVRPLGRRPVGVPQSVMQCVRELPVGGLPDDPVIDEGWGEPAPDEQGPRDAWLRAQRPPHWE